MPFSINDNYKDSMNVNIHKETVQFPFRVLNLSHLTCKIKMSRPVISIVHT